jgi:hypothetical protein
MAEIRVEPTRRRSNAWIWVLLLLVIIAGVVYWLYASGMLGTGAANTDSARGATTAPTAPATPTGRGN